MPSMNCARRQRSTNKPRSSITSQQCQADEHGLIDCFSNLTDLLLRAEDVIECSAVAASEAQQAPLE
jgi:hypothetical protein